MGKPNIDTMSFAKVYPLMREMRYLDKLIDELARGKPMEKILRAWGTGPRRCGTGHREYID